MPRRSQAQPSAAKRELNTETSGAGAPAARESRRKLAASAGEVKRARSFDRSDAEGGGMPWRAAREWRTAREGAGLLSEERVQVGGQAGCCAEEGERGSGGVRVGMEGGKDGGRAWGVRAGWLVEGRGGGEAAVVVSDAPDNERSEPPGR
jgi:hypothetical protein